MEHLVSMAVFARVVEAKSFSAAAVRLGMSKSAVSKQVARLEATLGARLLNRTTRQMSLTEVGEAFYVHCARMLAEAESAEQIVGQLRAAPRGQLRVSCPAAFGHLHIAPAIPAFLARHHDLKVDLTFTDRPVDLVEEGMDLAILITRAPAPGVIARALAPLRWVVCATRQYLERRGEPAHPSDLTSHNCLSYAFEGHDDAWHLQDEHGEVKIAVSGDFRVNNGEAIREAALAHHGIALLPRFVVWRDLQAGALRQVLPQYEPRGGSASNIYAVYLPSRYIPLKVRAFVDFYREQIGTPAYWDR
ncbi:LysR family transcriptional regulator [Aromatoleum buckelii]|uniref:LysR family transcriptional regulator n=1 Tax=Aromatoleum buckelii TaxID=200254 RepID=A0ABX1N798_9RHOO|nr:LysR family transcriptional regulator [Aromatoleum buckelii]MCK0512786.1 LysR family transcriptional regulator [Aromatoleum buckelii]